MGGSLIYVKGAMFRFLGYMLLMIFPWIGKTWIILIDAKGLMK